MVYPPFLSSPYSKFDVFLSFRGGEEASASKSFTNRLFNSLHHEGVSVFMDGDARLDSEESSIEYSSLRVVEGSFLCIPIVCADYACSESCLSELAKMVECQKKILPVFYDVDPSDVRHQRGSFEVAFQRHQSQLEEFNAGLVDQWKETFTEVADIAGYVITNEDRKTGHGETKWIQSIVKRVLCLLNNNAIDIGRYLVGIDSRAKDIMELLKLNENDVKMFGIHGMGGIGKTTLAKVVYNKIYKNFDASIFIPDIKEACKQYEGLASLQAKLLSAILQKENVEFDDVSRGITIIKKRAHIKRVLIVLDDVDHKEQLDALAGDKDWFRGGSRIIITTRDLHILNVQKLKEHEIYQQNKLDAGESLQLFSWHAFGREQPTKDYVELSEKVIRYADGLPLALEVLGSYLFDKKDVKEWQDTLEQLRHIPFEDVQQKLRISYDGLDDEDKKMFLDITFYLAGMDRDYVVDVCLSFDYLSRLAITVLLHKSLITIDEKNRIQMHDMLRDMGRGIVREEYPNEPHMHSRLWDTDEVEEILDNDKGTKNTEGIDVSFYGQRLKRNLHTKSLSRMPNLRLLIANYTNLEGQFQSVPANIRWLCWRRCPMSSLPDDFRLMNLGVLDLRSGNIRQLWDGGKLSTNMVFNKLRVINLRSCTQLESLPDFSNSPALEKLNLRNCSRLSELHDSVCNLKRLRFLDMSSCPRIRELPKQFCQLTRLEVLRLSTRGAFRDVPEQLGVMASLKELTFRQLGIRTVSISIGLLKNLRLLSFHGCRKLEELPNSIGNMKKVELFDLHGCWLIHALPDSVGKMENLVEVDFSETHIKELPNCIGSLRKLKKLFLQGCNELTNLPDEVGNLAELEILDLTKCTSLRNLPDTIGHISGLSMLCLSKSGIEEIPESIGNLVLLEDFQLSECINLVNLPSTIGGLVKIRKLDLNGCKLLTSLPDSIGLIEGLQILSLRSCSGLQSIPDSVKNLAQLVELDLHGCTSLESLPDAFSTMKSLRKLDLFCTEIEELPDSTVSLEGMTELCLIECSRLRCLPHQLGNLTKLEKLYLTDCVSLTALPDSIGEMKNLVHLELANTNIEKLPDSIKMLDKLDTLLLGLCRKLRCLPEGIGWLTKLEALDLCCKSLEMLPMSIGNLKNLQFLAVDGSAVESLPDTIGSLENLKKLDLSKSKLKGLPDHIGGLTKLEELLLLRCVSLTMLPDTIGNLTNLIILDISETSIEEIPHFIVLLKNLRTLKIKGCRQLRGLPLGKMNCLQYLHVKGKGEMEYKKEDYYQVPKSMSVLSGYSPLTQERRSIKLVESIPDIDELILYWNLTIMTREDTWIVKVVDEHMKEWGEKNRGMQWLCLIFPSEFVVSFG